MENSQRVVVAIRLHLQTYIVIAIIISNVKILSDNRFEGTK